MYSKDKLINTSSLNYLGQTRYALYSTCYKDPNCIEQLKNIINRYIPYTDIFYDVGRTKFIITPAHPVEISPYETAMSVYFDAICNIFRDFIAINRTYVQDGLLPVYREYSSDMSRFIEQVLNDKCVLCNLAQVFVVNNTIEFKL